MRPILIAGAIFSISAVSTPIISGRLRRSKTWKQDGHKRASASINCRHARPGRGVNGRRRGDAHDAGSIMTIEPVPIIVVMMVIAAVMFAATARSGARTSRKITLNVTLTDRRRGAVC